jgi:parallel beta-helix repeat protein
MSSSNNLLRENRILHAGIGINVGFESANTHLEENSVSENTGDGIFVDSATADTFIEGNRAKRNGDDGIDVENTSVAITDNIANRNVDLGIEALPGAGDGGGNRAANNGNPAQCQNVVCG